MKQTFCLSSSFLKKDTCLYSLLSYPWVSKTGGKPSFKNDKTYPEIYTQGNRLILG